MMILRERFTVCSSCDVHAGLCLVGTSSLCDRYYVAIIPVETNVMASGMYGRDRPLYQRT